MAEETISALKLVATSESNGVESSIIGIANAMRQLKSISGASFKTSMEKSGEGLAALTKSVSSVAEADIAKIERLASAMDKLKGIGAVKSKVNLTTGEAESVDKKTPTASSSKGNKFLSSIGRIAFYRAIRAAIRQVTQAFSEGYESALKWSEVNNTSLYESATRLSAATTTMKNNLGAMAGELMQTFEPVLVRLADAVSWISDKLAESFAYMRGDTTYQKARKVTAEMKKQTEEIKKQLLGFDEINKLNANYEAAETNGAYEMANVNKSSALTTAGITAAIIAALGIGTAFKLGDTLTSIIAAIGASKVIGGGITAGGGSVPSAVGTALESAAALAAGEAITAGIAKSGLFVDPQRNASVMDILKEGTGSATYLGTAAKTMGAWVKNAFVPGSLDDFIDDAYRNYAGVGNAPVIDVEKTRGSVVDSINEKVAAALAAGDTKEAEKAQEAIEVFVNIGSESIKDVFTRQNNRGIMGVTR